jgi:nicotinamide riboside transporter PnuC
MISWISSFLTITAIILNAYKNIWCWSVYMVTNVLWIIYFWPKHEWAVVVLNIVFFIFNLFAMKKWKAELRS